MDKEILKKIREIIERRSIDLIMIKNSKTADPNFFYLTQLEKGEFNHATLLVWPRRLQLFCSHFELAIAKAHGIPIAKKIDYTKAKIGLNYTTLPKSDFDAIKTKKIDVSKDLGIARSTKTKSELKKLAEAGRIASEILEQLIPKIEPGIRECELTGNLIKLIYDADCRPAFSPIVASGPNTRNIHHTPGKRALRRGDLLLIDFGVSYKKYCSDITRTFVLGKPNAAQRAIWETVQCAQHFALDQLREGANGSVVFGSVKEFLDGRYPHAFSHSLGHGLGVEVHDWPKDIGSTILKENMVFTIEPALYTRLGGVRIEDDVVITAGGYRLLTKPQKEFRI